MVSLEFFSHTMNRDGSTEKNFGPTIPTYKSCVRWKNRNSWEWPLFERANDTCLLLSIFATRYKSKPVVPSFSWRFPGPFPKNFLNNSFQRIPSTVITYVCRLLPFIFWPVHFQTWIWMSCKSTLSSSEIQNVNSGDDFSNRNSHFFRKFAVLNLLVKVWFLRLQSDKVGLKANDGTFVKHWKPMFKTSLVYMIN